MSRITWGVVLGVGLLLAGCGKQGSSSAGAGGDKSSVKIGFLVKQPEEPWFQEEWLFAQKAADKDGFKLITIGVPDGEKVLAAIDNLAAQGADGFIICTPDVKLGPAIVAKAEANNMKLMSVDDQFIGPDGKPMEVHHMGISARAIGQIVGQAAYDEMQKRKWNVDDTGACVVTYEELATGQDRVGGAIDALEKAGFPSAHFFKTAQKTTDVPGAIDAANIVLTQHPEIKHWITFGLNDEAALGAVRAMEGRGFSATDVIGVGIGGSTGKVDFEKDKPTGFYASVLLSAMRHGYETSDLMYHWIKDGKEPPKLTLTAGTLITRENYKKVMADNGE